MYRLSEDIIGPYSGIVYGRKGEEVQIISEHGNMVIAVGESGRPMPVKRSQLTGANELRQDPEPMETLMGTEKVKTEVSQVKSQVSEVREKVRWANPRPVKEPVTQSTLF